MCKSSTLERKEEKGSRSVTQAEANNKLKVEIGLDGD